MLLLAFRQARAPTRQCLYLVLSEAIIIGHSSVALYKVDGIKASHTNYSQMCCACIMDIGFLGEILDFLSWRLLWMVCLCHVDTAIWMTCLSTEFQVSTERLQKGSKLLGLARCSCLVLSFPRQRRLQHKSGRRGNKPKHPKVLFQGRRIAIMF